MQAAAENVENRKTTKRKSKLNKRKKLAWETGQRKMLSGKEKQKEDTDNKNQGMTLYNKEKPLVFCVQDFNEGQAV